MGLFLKNALDMGAKFPSPLNDGITSSQEDLREILTKLWNNQDNLNLKYYLICNSKYSLNYIQIQKNI